MSDAFTLTGRRVLVTGASRGIGLAVARSLGQNGASVIITGRKLDGLRTAHEQLKNAGVEATLAGSRVGDVGQVIEDFALGRGYEVVRDYCGHGIGRELHEEPPVHNFRQKGGGLKREMIAHPPELTRQRCGQPACTITAAFAGAALASRS